MAYRIVTKVFNNGKIEVASAEVDDKKENSYEETEGYDIYIDYVDTKHEVEAYFEECKNA